MYCIFAVYLKKNEEICKKLQMKKKKDKKNTKDKLEEEKRKKFVFLIRIYLRILNQNKIFYLSFL